MGSCANKQGTTPAIQTITGKIEPTPVKVVQTEYTRQNSQIKIEIDTFQRRQSKNKDKDKKNLQFFNNIEVANKILDAPNAQISNPLKTQKDFDLIAKCLKLHFIFKRLSNSQILEITNEMKLFTIEAKENVFKENQPGNNFFIVAKGSLEVTILGVRVNVLEPGMSFGEGALLQKAMRTATILSIENSSLWGLNREVFNKVIAELNAAEFKENMLFVENTSVFKELTVSQKDALVESLSVIYFKPGNYITKEGDNGNLLYIIKEGNAICSKNNEEVCRFSKGECFGEQALFFNCLRTATITALDEVKCIGISRETLINVLGSELQTIIHKNVLRLAFKSNNFLKKLSKLQEDLLVKSMEIAEFDEGSVIIPSGTLKQADIIVVLRGSLQSSSEIINVMKCIGEAAAIEDSKEVWKSDVTAAVQSTIAYISKESFETAIGGNYHESVGNNGKIRLLKNIPLFRMLTNEQHQNIIQAMKIEEYGDKCPIFQENDPGESLFIIKSGKVDVSKNNIYIRSITKNDYFGERSILFSSPRTATVIANGRVIVWVLFRNDFMRIISDKIRYNLIKKIELQDDTIQLNDLQVVKLLGKGLSGIVFLTVHKSKQILYALKTVHKQKIFEYNLYDGIQLEREILLQLDHSFIMKLVKTFKDHKRIYFLTEFVRGSDLFDVVRAMNYISEKDSKFFIGCLLSALENLHEKSIAYRDLKPENVVVDDEGYLKMIDFGTAKFVKSRTFTVVGTPQYMAPEVILRTGYGLSVDYWSLGVMLFEILFGYVPFGEDDNDPMIVYEKVLERSIEYPKIGINSYVESKNIIEQFLSVNPLQRTGGSIEIVKRHPWFKELDWDLLNSRELKPPYIPKVSMNDKEIQKALTDQKDLESFVSSEENEKMNPNLGDVEDWDKHF